MLFFRLLASGLEFTQHPKMARPLPALQYHRSDYRCASSLRIQQREVPRSARRLCANLGPRSPKQDATTLPFTASPEANKRLRIVTGQCDNVSVLNVRVPHVQNISDLSANPHAFATLPTPLPPQGKSAPSYFSAPDGFRLGVTISVPCFYSGAPLWIALSESLFGSVLEVKKMTYFSARC
jgi:hypothetical protein